MTNSADPDQLAYTVCKVGVYLVSAGLRLSYTSDKVGAYSSRPGLQTVERQASMYISAVFQAL